MRRRKPPHCEDRRYHPRAIGLEFETVYRSAISSAFPDLEAKVYFYTEIEALARYLFKHYQI